MASLVFRALLPLVPLIALGCQQEVEHAQQPKPQPQPAGTATATAAPKTEDETPAAKKDAPPSGSKAAAMQNAVDVAALRLKKAEIAVASQAEANKTAVDFARREVDLAKGKVESFKALEMPNKLAQAELDLRRAKDSAQEDAEELKQIEIMYDKQNLDDKTAEFVVNRGKRKAERSAAAIEIQTRGFELLAHHEMPRELARLQLDLERKQDELARATRNAESEAMDREIGLVSARGEHEKALFEQAVYEAESKAGRAK